LNRGRNGSYKLNGKDCPILIWEDFCGDIHMKFELNWLSLGSQTAKAGKQIKSYIKSHPENPCTDI